MKYLLLVVGLAGGITQGARAATSHDSMRVASKQNLAKVQYGVASYYSKKFTNKKTASGQLYDPEKMTAAHNFLPMNTWIRVTNLRNKRSVIVRINDRLHHRNKRLVDLSSSAAAKLGYLRRGITRVKIEVIQDKKKISELSSQSYK
jgi:rare lipoprotein A